MTTETTGISPVNLSAADIAAIEAIMAEASVERDQAVAAYLDITDDMDCEPKPALATNEAEETLGRYTSRRFKYVSERIRIAEQMQAMLRGLDAKIAGLDFVMKPQAIEFTKTLLANKKGKSVKFAHGTCGFRAVPGSVEIPTEKMPAVVEWCEANLPDAVRIRKEVVKTPIGDLFKLSGEQIPGVIYHEPRDKFYVS